MELVLRPLPPFSFDLTASLFSTGDRSIRRYEDGRFWQVVRAADQLILVTVTSTGTIDAPQLHVEARSGQSLPAFARPDIERVVTRIFNLNLDIVPFYHAVKGDSVLAKLIPQLRGLKTPAPTSAFEALIDSITQQQISLVVARTMANRMVKLYGDSLELDGQTYYAYPTPHQLAAATVEGLRGCGLSNGKSRHIIDISRLIAEEKLSLEKMKDYPDVNQIIAELDAIPGIGPWTAEFTVLRGMARFEIIPADDLGLKRLVSHFYFGERTISSEDVRKLAEAWNGWKGLAAIYLIVARRLGMG